MVHQNGSRELTGFSTIMPQPFPACTLERANVLSFDNLASSNWPVSPHRKLLRWQYQHTSGEWAAHCCFPLELILALRREKVNWGRNPLCLFPSKLDPGTEEKEGNLNDPSQSSIIHWFVLEKILTVVKVPKRSGLGLDPLWCPCAISRCQLGPPHPRTLSYSIFLSWRCFASCLHLAFIARMRSSLVWSLQTLIYKCSCQCLGLDFLL